MCGATSAQNNLEAAQASYYTTLQSQAAQEFSESSQIYKDLTSTFEPILAAGPGQTGFSEAEVNNLNSQAATSQGQSYATAEQAVNRQLAAGGAGLPSGVATQVRTGLAGSASQNLSTEQQQIQQSNYAQGYSNWQQAAGALAGAPSVYSASTSAAGVANTAGSDAASTANQIAQEGDAWLGAVGGALGGVAGAATSFGLGKLPTGCWIAASYWGSWTDPRTVLVRSYLNGPFSETWYGRPIMSLYLKFGQRIARYPRIVRMLGPLFELALRKASK